MHDIYDTLDIHLFKLVEFKMQEKRNSNQESHIQSTQTNTEYFVGCLDVWEL